MDEGVVDRLGRGLAHVRVLRSVLGRRRAVVESGAVALEQLLQVLAVGRLERGSTWSSWTPVEVWVIGIVPPSEISGDQGCPA